MSTLKQVEANRLNSQKSTGPKSEAGKHASSRNALKSGLDAASQFVPGETAEAFTQLQSEYYDRFQPATPDLRFQVDNLIRNEWLLRRFHRVEAQLWQFHAMQADRSTGVALGEAFATANSSFMRLQRRVTAAEKAYKEAMNEVKRLQQAPQPEESKTETDELASFLTDDKDGLDIAGLELFLQKKLAKEPAAGPALVASAAGSGL